MKIGIIGSGKFGLVLASIAMENNNEVVIFSRRKQEVDSINTNKKFEITGKEALKVHYLIDEMIESSKKNKLITME